MKINNKRDLTFFRTVDSGEYDGIKGGLFKDEFYHLSIGSYSKDLISGYITKRIVGTHRANIVGVPIKSSREEDIVAFAEDVLNYGMRKIKKFGVSKSENKDGKPDVLIDEGYADRAKELRQKKESKRKVKPKF